MGDQIDCCRRPTNLGKRDIKSYRGVKPKDNPNIPSLNSKDFDNFGSFKKTNNTNKNLNKKGKSYLNSIYEKDSNFPNFSEFDIEPVSEPLNKEQIYQPENEYITNNQQTQYIDSNPVINQQNQIIQDTNYVNSTNNYSPPEIKSDNVQYLQQDYTTNNYEQPADTNYINKNNQDFMNAININGNNQPVEYISSTNNENILNQYLNGEKKIQIENPAIYANNDKQYQSINEYIQSPVTNYIESSTTNQSYEQYNFNNTNTSPQYYDSKSNVNYIPSNIENIYTNQNQYAEEITNPQFNQIQNTNYTSQNSYINNPKPIYIQQNPQQISMDNKQEIERQIYSQNLNNYNENELYGSELIKREKGKNSKPHKKPKKMKKIRKIIEYYSEDEDEEEEEDDNDEEKEESSSQNEEIEEERPKNKKIMKKIKNKNIKNKKEIIKNRKKSKNNKKQNRKSFEDKENESDNMDYEHNENKDNKLKNVQLKEEEEEFSGFQKEPEMRESFGDIIDNSGDVYENKNRDDLKFKNKKIERQMISLKNGNKIIGNFKKEEIGENIKEIAKKEREELFHGKTLKVASVEKKEETTGCQVPGFLSNIFAKIF